jgi:hypothetical protein
MNHIDANKGIQERGRGLNNRNPDKWKEREWWNQIILWENVLIIKNKVNNSKIYATKIQRKYSC